MFSVCLVTSDLRSLFSLFASIINLVVGCSSVCGSSIINVEWIIRSTLRNAKAFLRCYLSTYSVTSRSRARLEGIDLVSRLRLRVYGSVCLVTSDNRLFSLFQSSVFICCGLIKDDGTYSTVVYLTTKRVLALMWIVCFK